MRRQQWSWVGLLCLLYGSLAAGEADARRVAAAAEAQVGVTTGYDPAYVRLDYPGGDVPKETGVCADVVVRAFRAIGTDLQKAVHEDMAAHFPAYPQNWGLKRPDPHIDHRRVANLMTWFTRQGRARALPVVPAECRGGDVVAWRLPGGRLHIGVVASGAGAGAGAAPLVVHNIGAGARKENVLLAWTVIGWYR